MSEQRYTNTDPSLHYNHAEPQVSGRWRGAWFWCLKHYDYESAALIHERNAPPSDECADGDHDLCPFEFCNCPHHRATDFPLQHKPLQSLREVESQRAESEEAA